MEDREELGLTGAGDDMSDVLKILSREQLRLQIAGGSQEEVWAAFDELIRRNMEEEQESTTLVEITLENSKKWRKLVREDPDATIDIYEEFEWAIEELNWLREQVEEVEKWYEGHKKEPIPYQKRPTGWDRLGRILDKEFERSDSSLISRHIALRERVKEAKLQADAPLWFLEALESLLEGT